VYDRYNVKYTNIYQVFPSIGPVPCAGGKFVLAEDAINREAVLQAQIRTLEVQNGDLKRGATTLVSRLEDVELQVEELKKRVDRRIEDASNIAILYDLGTPEGWEIAKEIRKLKERAC
jgi:hypothetical protein